MKKFYFLCALCAAVLTANATEGALSGLFSVNEDGKQIQFSQGNLQYHCTNHVWQFAEHQYDIIDSVSNSSISDTYNGWVDLFGWGTGDDPTSRQRKNSFTDWGINAISNGGNLPNTWRTLTSDEWNYLLVERTDAAVLFTLGTVNNVPGLILLPDNWEEPDGVALTISNEEGLAYVPNYATYRDMDETNDHYTDNILTTTEWAAVEAAGAVFLPTNPYRVENNTQAGSFDDYRTAGGYWTSTGKQPHIYGTAYNFLFSPTEVWPAESINASENGFAVRMVYCPECAATTAIYQVEDALPSNRKCIKDGQLLIYHNGQTFTAQGSQLR
ncbi:MAG: hypothetical protein K6A36_07500 [Paludibacteraceae bacterium]|nr:hypothetical protein [Paludibacteraceae bacterium]